MDVVNIWGYRLIKDSLDIIPLNSKVVVNTMSPNSYGLATKDKKTENALKNSDYLVLDGAYFGFAPLLLKGEKLKRFAGWDCFQYFSNAFNEKKGRVFFLGSTEETLLKIKARYKLEFPDIEVEVLSPPFKPEFSDQDNLEMHKKINAFKPDILFIGLTAPKQERWGTENKSQVNTHIICGIGNVFDWYAGNSNRPGVFWQKIGLEWFIRIFYRPEVFRRNIANQMIFFKDLLLALLKLKKI